jgi:hypothetical protein
MSLEITEELIARQTPEAQAIIRALLSTIRQLHDPVRRYGWAFGSLRPWVGSAFFASSSTSRQSARPSAAR